MIKISENEKYSEYIERTEDNIREMAVPDGYYDIISKLLSDLRNCVGEHGRCQFCKSYRANKGKSVLIHHECDYRGMLHTDTCPDWEWVGFDGIKVRNVDKFFD